LEFARGLVAKNNGVSLNWATYVLATHKSFLQVGKDNKRAISQPIAISEQVNILQGVRKSKNVLKAKYAKGVARGYGGKNSFSGHFGLGSRVFNCPPMNVSRLNGIHTLKGKVKLFFTIN
jgi:hypothetical protein